MSHIARRPAFEPDQARTEAIERYFAAIEAGNYAALSEVLTSDAVTRWPQSHELIVGAASCALVYANYPGGPPTVHLRRLTGGGAAWIAESTADYGDDRWHIVSIFEFDGARIASITDYFGPTIPAPDWRKPWVEREYDA